MLRKKLAKKLSLSDKLTNTIAKPNDDDDSSSGSQDEQPRFEADFDEYEEKSLGSTDFRKRNVKLLSEQSDRYKGKISTRHIDGESEDDNDSDEMPENSEESENGNEGAKNDSDDQDSNDEDEENFSEEEDKQDSLDEEGEEDSESQSEDDESSANVIKDTNYQSEIQKGICVQNQLRIWEKLLEIRIHTQKILNKSNQLPPPSKFQELIKENPESAKLSKECCTQANKCLKSLLALQNVLSNQFPELRNATKNSLKRKSPFDDSKDDDSPPLKRLSDHLGAHHHDIKSYRNSVLLKWDDRTKLLTPGAGLKKKSLNEEHDVVRKIENALINRSVLIEKSQTPRGKQTNTGDPIDLDKASDSSERCTNIYDDNDFYHQQLRELIEYKANTSTSMTEVTRQYVELQKLRKKMKKTVDTRASKGRKLRYIVHNKLVNFMAPDNPISTWTEQSKDELYKSLFV